MMRNETFQVAKGVRHQGSESGAGLEEKLAQETRAPQGLLRLVNEPFHAVSSRCRAAASAYFNFLIVLKEQDLLVLYRRHGS